MNRFDKVRIEARGVQVEILALASFGYKPEVDPISGIILSKEYKLKKQVLNEIIGLNSLIIKYMPDNFCTVLFEFTGKFLPVEYRNLINKENILSYLEHLNYFKYVKIGAQDFLQKSKVRTLDSTIDIQVEEDPTNYLNYLNHLVSKMETDFGAKRYNNGNVDLKRKTETNRQPVTGYDKCKELKKRKNALFRELLPPEDREYFKTVLRFEQKLSNTREIYQAFNMSSKTNSLLNILHSDIYPVVNTLNTLFDSLEVPNV